MCSGWINFTAWIVGLSGCITLLIGAWYWAKKDTFQKPFFGTITYLSFFCLGAVNIQFRSPEFQPGHFTHFISEDNLHRLLFDVVSTRKPDSFNIRFIAEVRSVDATSTHGKLLVYLRKDTIKHNFQPGDRFYVFGKPNALANPKNPGEFNYAKYLRSKDIFRQLRITSEEILVQKPDADGLFTKMQGFRTSLLRKLESLPFGPEELSIVQALTLGHKHGIDTELYKSYAEAGAIHVLAVSGLHVGIIYFLLSWLFQPLIYLPKGRKITVILVVLSLVLYAFMTGMSPSVTRAVTMFSFFGLARLLNRPTNSINTLFLSFFFLILWNPKLLFDVGFQLSYAAVFFILWLHPKIAAIYRPKYYLDKIIWNTLSVSFCAQLGVAPLSIYYFNQFPGLFLLSNVVILPFIGILVGGGLSIIILEALDLTPGWLIALINWFVKLLNRFVVWISDQEAFIFRDLVITETGVISLYVLVICFTTLLSRFTYNKLKILLLSVILLLITIPPMKVNGPTNKLVIFHKYKRTIIGIQKDKSILVLKQDSARLKDEYPIASFRKEMQSKFYSEEIIPSVLAFNHSTIMVIDSSGVYPKNRQVDMILLSGNPRVHLDLLIDNLRPSWIIADGSNYRSFVRRWKETCRNRKLPFHHTGDSGAFILE